LRFFSNFNGGISLYKLLLYLHITSVIASLGPFFLLYPLVRRMERSGREEILIWLPLFTNAVRLSKHSGHVLVASGILLMWLGRWPWLTSWVVITLVIMVSSLFFIARAFSPALKQLKLPDSDWELLMKKLKFNLNLYVVLMLAMLWFMVAKPSLW
jgi:hypothetical protein